MVHQAVPTLQPSYRGLYILTHHDTAKINISLLDNSNIVTQIFRYYNIKNSNIYATSPSHTCLATWYRHRWSIERSEGIFGKPLGMIVFRGNRGHINTWRWCQRQMNSGSQCFNIKWSFSKCGLRGSSFLPVNGSILDHSVMYHSFLVFIYFYYNQRRKIML